MWYEGTPDLRNYWEHQIGGAYLWMPNNKWQLTINYSYHWYLDHVVPVYRPFGPDGTMLRKYLNNGNFHQSHFSVTGVAKFLNRNLIVKLTPFVDRYKSTGEYSLSITAFNAMAQATWYFGGFYLSGWYYGPLKWAETDNGRQFRTQDQYQIAIGYSAGDWNFRVAADNFLRTNWETQRSDLESEWYEDHRISYGTYRHRDFSVSVTYTFGYGKKVQRGNEVGASGADASGILK